MNVIAVKVISGFLFFTLVISFGGLPFWCLRKCVTKYKTGETHENHLPLVNFLHSTASGVLVGTCLLSLLPEAIESVHQTLGTSRTMEGRREVLDQTTNLTQEVDEGQSQIYNYPLAELIVALGFLTIYMVDSSFKAAQTSYRKKQIDQNKKVFELKETKFYSKNSDVSKDELNETNASSVSDKNTDNGGQSLSSETFSEMLQNTSLLEGSMRDTDSEQEQGMSVEEEHPLSDQRQRQLQSAISQSVHLHSIALVGALCIHGFLDGVLLGLQTSMHVLLSLLLALAVHKVFVAVSLSVTLFNHRETSSRAALFIFLFSLVAPMGLILSAGILHGTADAELGPGLAAGCVQAFAVGTFMYVAFNETMEQQKMHGKSLRTQLVSHGFLVLGFAAMAGLRAALGEV